MSTNSFEQNTFWLLIQAVTRIKPYLGKIAEAHSLTPIQLGILCRLEPGTTYPMSTLASLLHCDASNVTGLVDRMLTHKLLTRFECANDRRIKMIELTPTGAKLRTKIITDTVNSGSEELNSIYTKSEQEQLHSLLQKLLTSPIAATAQSYKKRTDTDLC